MSSPNSKRPPKHVIRSSTAYEKFVREVHQSLVNQDAVKNIDVQHNVTIKGKSGATHQIDVYWEFEVAGNVYKTCIECKEHSSAVKKTHVASFIAVLDDIGGVTGIFVTTKSYQKGAKLLAKQGNVRLLVLNPVLQTVSVCIQLTSPRFNVKLVLDPDAIRAAAARDADVDDLAPSLARGAMLLDAAGAPIATLVSVLNEHVKSDGQHQVPLDGYFVSSVVGLLPLRHAIVDCTSSTHEEELLIDVSGTVKAILDDVLENTSSYVHEDGTTEPGPGKDGGPRLIPG